MTERLIRYVFDGDGDVGELAGEAAASAEAQAELVRIAASLAQLPGDGARAAEARLDQLLDAVTLAAVGEVVSAAATVKTR
jgi:hypothetical protein